ncbi:hypothetical protein CTAYLR_002037 [Chrysophaeum taylorii]|uniref:U-box domain-containing protein n=1 Tax=Chrysophaeum taylorii TaxID=2483200 RepID=A0AAD7UPU2_9STRA|nr:hypothetical protein CTAYLR_002037 [Chrysophaeum taylorii]
MKSSSSSEAARVARELGATPCSGWSYFWGPDEGSVALARRFLWLEERQHVLSAPDKAELSWLRARRVVVDRAKRRPIPVAVLEDLPFPPEVVAGLDEAELMDALPKIFACPITREAMADPVLASDGITYERHAIETWLEKRRTSPVTREFLAGGLIENRAIADATEALARAGLVDESYWARRLSRRARQPADPRATLRKRKRDLEARALALKREVDDLRSERDRLARDWARLLAIDGAKVKVLAACVIDAAPITSAHKARAIIQAAGIHDDDDKDSRVSGAVGYVAHAPIDQPLPPGDLDDGACYYYDAAAATTYGPLTDAAPLFKLALDDDDRREQTPDAEFLRRAAATSARLLDHPDRVFVCDARAFDQKPDPLDAKGDPVPLIQRAVVLVLQADSPDAFDFLATGLWDDGPVHQLSTSANCCTIL